MRGRGTRARSLLLARWSARWNNHEAVRMCRAVEGEGREGLNIQRNTLLASSRGQSPRVRGWAIHHAGVMKANLSLDFREELLLGQATLTHDRLIGAAVARARADNGADKRVAILLSCFSIFINDRAQKRTLDRADAKGQREDLVLGIRVFRENFRSGRRSSSLRR